MEAVAPLFGVFMVFVAFPWIILHYVTQWKKSATLTLEDERLLDELHDLARRLDDRTGTVERIMTADNPNWRGLACDPATTGIEDLRRSDNIENIRRER